MQNGNVHVTHALTRVNRQRCSLPSACGSLAHINPQLLLCSTCSSISGTVGVPLFFLEIGYSYFCAQIRSNYVSTFSHTFLSPRKTSFAKLSINSKRKILGKIIACDRRNTAWNASGFFSLSLSLTLQYIGQFYVAFELFKLLNR